MASNTGFRGRISEGTVRKAVKALLKWRKLHPKRSPQPASEDDAEGDQEFNDYDASDGFLYLILALKKIPPKELSKAPQKIPLPHSLNSSNINLCLIIDDRPIKSPYRITSEAAQKRIQSEDIPITKVLKLSKLKSDYSSFEARRNLYNSYDMFFADRRVIPLLPKLLGKHFYKKKRKVPVPLDLRQSSSWKEQIETASDSSLLCFGGGTCSVLRVGRCGLNSVMGSDEIVENVFAAIKGILDVVPKKWIAIRALHLKLSDSLALLIYEALPDLRLNIEDEVRGAGLQSGNDEKLKDKKMTKGRNVQCRNDGGIMDEAGDSEAEGCDNEKIRIAETTGMKRKKEENAINEGTKGMKKSLGER